MKIRPVGAELFHADGETHGRADGHDEANSRFSQFRGGDYKKITSRVHDIGFIISTEDGSVSSRPSVLANAQHTVSYCLHQRLWSDRCLRLHSVLSNISSWVYQNVQKLQSLMCKERNKSKPHFELREFKFGYCCQFQYAWRLADILDNYSTWTSAWLTYQFTLWL